MNFLVLTIMILILSSVHAANGDDAQDLMDPLRTKALYETAFSLCEYNSPQQFQMLKEAAELGHGWSAFYVGNAYKDGNYAQTSSMDEACRYYEMCLTAVIGNEPPLQAEANCALGNIYYDQNDLCKAKTYYEQAVAAGCPRSQGLLVFLKQDMDAA